ncbi:MAG: flagellar basal body-associated FliL family protein [Alphaproteobacteria bacterium]
MSNEEADDGSGDEIADGEEGSGKSGLGGKKLILFIVLPLLLLVGGGAGVYFSGMLDSVLGVEQAAGENPPAEEAAAEMPSHYVDLDEMLVTLAGKGRKQSFLKMRISLELAGPEDEVRVAAVMPRIIDNFQVFLRELRVEELQGSQGVYRVKEELLARVNTATHPAKVKDVLFREILVQ